MKPFAIFLAAVALALTLQPRLLAALPVSTAQLQAAFGQHHGAFVLIDCATGEAVTCGAASEPLPPCSTFKIWNTLAGLELGLVSSPDDPFYQWDGKPQFLHEWERDLTLKEAFQASCVPAYQQLARKIGPERMDAWIRKIGYGNRDISAGIDTFWLPAPGRKTILITPAEQAALIRRLVCGELPVSEKSRAVLKVIMKARETLLGTLYGKTGTAPKDWRDGLGWYAGYVESHGRTYAFTCELQGGAPMGKDARALVEAVLEQSGLL